MTSRVLSPTELKGKLRGAIAFPVTPFTASGEVDLEIVHKNAGWLATTGICGLVAPSGTGELYALTPEECTSIAAASVQAASSHVPVIAGVGFNASIGKDLAIRAEHLGADGILILPPYYASPDRQGLSDYYREIAQSTSLGIIIYTRDSAIIDPESLVNLVETTPNLVALKDGHGDLRLFQQLRDSVTTRFGPERLAWLAGAGDDLVAPYFAAGVQAFTSSLACFWPEASVKLYEVASSGSFEEFLDLHLKTVYPIYELRRRRPGFEVSVMKAAMEILGCPVGPVRPPLANIDADTRDELSAILDRLEIPGVQGRVQVA